MPNNSLTEPRCQVALEKTYTPTQTQACVTSGMANLNLAPPPPSNAATNINPPPPLYSSQPNMMGINPTHMPLPNVSKVFFDPYSGCCDVLFC